MGITSSRKILCSSGEPSKSKGDNNRNLKSIFTSDRLVCDELCKKVQRVVPDKKPVKKEKAATAVESVVDVNPAVEIETALETAPIEVIETPAVSEE